MLGIFQIHPRMARNTWHENPARRPFRENGWRAGVFVFFERERGRGGLFLAGGGVLWGEGGVCFFVGDIEDIL